MHHCPKDNSIRIGEEFHSYVCRKMLAESLEGSVYFVTFIDECFQFITVILNARRRDVPPEFEKFQKMFERRYDCKIKTLHSLEMKPVVFTCVSSVNFRVSPAHCT